MSVIVLSVCGMCGAEHREQPLNERSAHVPMNWDQVVLDGIGRVDRCRDCQEYETQAVEEARRRVRAERMAIRDGRP